MTLANPWRIRQVVCGLPGGKHSVHRVSATMSAMLLGAVITSLLGALAACADSPTNPTASKSAFRPLADVVPATRTEFAGFICFGGGTDGEVVVTPGGTLHLRGATNVNRWVTGNPLIDGVEHNLADANIDLKTGSGSIHLSLSLTPDAVNGTWEITQTVTLNESASSNGAAAFARGVGRGTGDLSGMTIEYTLEPAGPISDGCDSGFGPQLHGFIVSHG